MVIGLRYGPSQPGDLAARAKTNELTRKMMDKFQKENGSYLCRDLLGYDISIPEQAQKARESGLFVTFCPQKIESAVRILDELLASAESDS